MIITFTEQSHDSQLFNMSGEKWFSDFKDVASLKDLDTYMRTTLLDKFYNVEENGAQKGENFSIN